MWKMGLVIFLPLCLRAQLPDAPQPMRPFSLNASVGEREQEKKTGALFPQTVIGTGVSYQFLHYKAFVNVYYGYGLQVHENNFGVSLNYRLLQFGKRKQ